jgi:hypothetical protein
MVPRYKEKTLWVLVGILAICLGWGVVKVKAASDIILISTDGQVEVRNPQADLWRTVGNNTILHYGDMVRTGSQSKAEIRFETGIIRMYENTLLEFPSQPQGIRVSDDSEKLKSVFLRKGRSLFEIFKNRLNSGFEVSSPSLIAGVKGTIFRVAEEEGLKGVTVLEGVVAVTNRQNPAERTDVTANHYILLMEEHLMPAREFQREDLRLQDSKTRATDQKIENPTTRTPDTTAVDHQKTNEQQLQKTRVEERLTDLLERNRDLRGEALSNSIQIKPSSTTSPRTDDRNIIPPTSDTTTVTNTQATLSGTTGTVAGTVTNAESTLSSTTQPVTDLTRTILGLP